MDGFKILFGLIFFFFVICCYNLLMYCVNVDLLILKLKKNSVCNVFNIEF